MSQIPEDLKYTEEHEWLKMIDEDTALVGITDHAQESLGDITFVELPGAGEDVAKGDTFGVVESVKAASDLYMPVDAEVIESNPELETNPEILNEDPYESGWLMKIKIKEASQVEGLMSAQEYAAITG